MILTPGAQVIVTDDDGHRHTATIIGSERIFSAIRRYELVVDDSGQILNLFPEQFTQA
jgi:hypothetical protein